MNETKLDPADLESYRDFLEMRGLNPEHFRASASAGNQAEGVLGPSSGTATVTHLPSGTARTYSVRTWMADFKVDEGAGVFMR